MFGLLHLDKPRGLTSRDVVDRVQRLIRPHKCGHAGTLDPLATGVLVCCLGPATRLIEYVQRQPKRYVGTFALGRESPTEDVEGEITLRPDDPQPTAAQIEAILPQFLGTIQQRPPAFSALKVDGKRAYRLARQGEVVELAPRPVEIYSLTVVAYDYPQLVLDIACGSGTYVRSLGRDIAAALGTAAVMTDLRRTAIGPFTVNDALSVDELTADAIAKHLHPAKRAVADLPQLVLTAEQVAELVHGRPLRLADDVLPAAEAAAVDPQGELATLLTYRDGRWWPLRVFVHSR